MKLAREHWNRENYQEFCDFLFAEAEEGYREFVLGGTITERTLLGVRVPRCREIAKEILKGAALEFLKFEPVTFEEVMVRGLVIAGLPYDEMVARLKDFVALIDNWEICDVFCAATGKNVRKHRAEFLEEIDKMLWSLDEFQTRFALVSLLDHYIVADYLPVIFDRLSGTVPYLSDGPGELSVERAAGSYNGERVRDVMAWDAYYVKMAVAWLVATCFCKFPEETYAWFVESKLPRWTHNKAIAKACESYRVDRDLKAELKKLKHPKL